MDWTVKDLAIGNYEDAMAHDRLHARGITGVLTLKQLPHLRHPKFVWRQRTEDERADFVESLVSDVTTNADIRVAVTRDRLY